jgi:hypothetical protein
MTRLLPTLRAFLRRPERVPVVLTMSGCIYVHPVHYDRVVATMPKPCDRYGSLGRVPTCTTVHSDPFMPAYRYPTRWENAREAWRHGR